MIGSDAQTTIPSASKCGSVNPETGPIIAGSPITNQDYRVAAIPFVTTNGAATLSAGGGSFPNLECLCASDLLRRARVELLPMDALADDANVAMVAMAGALLAMTERFVDADHFSKPVRALEALGHRFDAIIGHEIGSMNGIIPVLVAARTGLPLIDADTMGRSFSQAHMSSFALAGVLMTPMALCDIRDNAMVMTQTRDGRWTETMMRTVTTSLFVVA